jgi:hypothetical protein
VNILILTILPKKPQSKFQISNMQLSNYFIRKYFFYRLIKTKIKKRKNECIEIRYQSKSWILLQIYFTDQSVFVKVKILVS